MDHLGKFDVNVDDGYLLGYSFVSKSFRVFNIIRQQVNETFHVTFDESMKAIKFLNTLVDETQINDSSRYPPYEFLHKNDPSRQYQADSDISYYIIPHNRSITEIINAQHVPVVIIPTEQNTSNTKETEGPHDLSNTKGTNEQLAQAEQIDQVTDDFIIELPLTEDQSMENSETLVPTTKISLPDIFQSPITTKFLQV
ncbi:hypothetical protein Tco_1026227 [Tanacetum coccineum]